MAANSTAIWRVRPGGNNNNGAGFDTGIASAGTDYSQQDGAHLSQSGGTVSTATTTLTDSGASFTADLIGNGIMVAGTGITTTYTFITGVPSGTTLTLQTSPGTAGTAVTFNIGGGWVDFWTNCQSTGPLVPGNFVYILGSGTPNYTSYTYDYVFTGSAVTLTAGIVTNTTGNGMIVFANDPATPGYKAAPDTTGGMPTLQAAGPNAGTCFSACSNNKFIGLWCVKGATTPTQIWGTGTNLVHFGCVYDAFGHLSGFVTSDTNGNVVGCEMFDSVSGSAGNTADVVSGSAITIVGCNLHDIGSAVQATGNHATIANNIFSNFGNRILVQGSGVVIINNTIDHSSADGIQFTTSGAACMSGARVMNNIISNCTVAGKFGINVNFGAAAQNDACKAFIDYNVFYNNTADLNNLSYGPHDTHGGSNPYVGQSTENYQLA